MDGEALLYGSFTTSTKIWPTGHQYLTIIKTLSYVLHLYLVQTPYAPLTSSFVYMGVVLGWDGMG